MGFRWQPSSETLEICAGSQILATTDVLRVGDRCGGDTTWRPLGTRTLRDVQTPIEVVDLVPAVDVVRASGLDGTEPRSSDRDRRDGRATIRSAPA